MRSGRRCLGALMLALTLFSAMPEAEAADPYPARTGRRTALASWGMMGSAGVVFGTGALLSIYDFNGPWQRKYIYDQHYVRRSDASTGMYFTALGVVGASVPTLMTGALLEGVALRRVTRHTTWTGWVSVASMAAGGVALVIGVAAWAPALTVISIHLGVIGWTMAIVQFSHNVVTSKKLSAEVFEQLYGRERKGRVKVRATLAPVLTRESKGIALVGVF